MKIKRLVFPAILLLSALVVSCFPSQSGLRIDNKAPDFTLPNLQEQSVSLSSLRGKGVLINFWKST